MNVEEARVIILSMIVALGSGLLLWGWWDTKKDLIQKKNKTYSIHLPKGAHVS